MEEKGVEDVSPGTRAKQRLLTMWSMPRSGTKDKSQSSGTKGERKGLRDVTNVTAELPPLKKKEREKPTEILTTSARYEPLLAEAQTQVPSSYCDADSSLTFEEDVDDVQHQTNDNSAIKARAPTIEKFSATMTSISVTYPDCSVSCNSCRNKKSEGLLHALARLGFASQVLVRIRPLSESEMAKGGERSVLQDGGRSLMLLPSQNLQAHHSSGTERYFFDHVVGENEQQVRASGRE